MVVVIPLTILDTILVIYPEEMRACINGSALVSFLQKFCRVLNKQNCSLIAHRIKSALRKSDDVLRFESYPGCLMCQGISIFHAKHIHLL
jgi:hypothetical protein